MKNFIVTIRYYDAGDFRDTILTTEEETAERARLFIERFKNNCPSWRIIRYTQVINVKENQND